MGLGDVAAPLLDHGFESEQIDFALRRAREGELVEQLPPDGDPHSLRLATTGAYLVKHLPKSFEYLDAVVVDTPITDPNVRGGLEVVKSIQPRLDRAELFLGYLDRAWEQADLEGSGLFEWPTAAAAVRGEIEAIRSRLDVG